MWKALEWIIARVRKIVYWTYNHCYKQRLIITLIKESKMGLVYRVFPTVPGASDVVSREVELKENDSTTYITIDTASKYIDLPPVKRGSAVSVRLRDSDSSGNTSDWSAPLAFTAVDTLIPPVPGFDGVKLVAQVEDPIEPEVHPLPEPEPEPEPPTPETEPEVSEDPLVE